MENIEVPDFHPPEMPRHTRQIRDALAPELFERYFNLAAELDEPVRTAAMLLPCTGLRGGEMVGLPLGCMKRSKITLRDGTEKGVLMFRVFGKGGHERWVPLLDEGAQMVVGYLRGWRRSHSDAKWLFPGRKGHMSDRTLRAALQHIRTPLGMRFTPHTMRRTYLTTLYRKGVDIGYLAKIAGHTDTKTLLNHYLAINDIDIATAVHETGGSLKGSA
jgi:integrase